MRKVLLAALAIAVALVAQLTVLNGLRLPGGGVPDLILVLVASIGMASGPVPGMLAGFLAGLCVDLAPPASQLVGQYALVFCLAGWAAGRLSFVAARSAVRAMIAMMVVVAAAEALAAAVGAVLEPAQVSLASIRQVLPSTVLYDVAITPFVLYLVIMASKLLAPAPEVLPASALLSPAARSGRRQHQPRLRRAAARTADGWVGGGPRSVLGGRPPARQTTRLRPADGVAGSASGLVHRPGLPASPVHLRLSTRRRRDGIIGGAALGTAGAAGLGSRSPARHPGLRARGRTFRPHHGELGGSASGQISRAYRSRPRESVPINFGAHRGDGSVGTTLARNGLVSAGGSATGSRTGGIPGAVPKVDFRVRAPATTRRQAATPRFRRKNSLLRPSAVAFSVVGGGVLEKSTFAAARRGGPTPRLRLGRRGSGMLGGSSRAGTSLRSGTARVRKEPRFGYGRKSWLSFLVQRRVGGRWLATRRAGRRSGSGSGSAMIRRRTGGAR
ncbi:MAG TPA: rod shape-determining protein MreD [Streptosporangiaceae bacterium]